MARGLGLLLLAAALLTAAAPAAAQVVNGSDVTAASPAEAVPPRPDTLLAEAVPPQPDSLLEAAAPAPAPAGAATSERVAALAATPLPRLPAFPAELPSSKSTVQYSHLWGRGGELWNTSSRIPDLSHAGYMGGCWRRAYQLGLSVGRRLTCAFTTAPASQSRCALPSPTHPPARPPAAAGRAIPLFPVGFSGRDFGAVGDGEAGAVP